MNTFQTNKTGGNLWLVGLTVKEKPQRFLKQKKKMIPDENREIQDGIKESTNISKYKP